MGIFTGLKPQKRIPFHLTQDKDLSLKHEQQEVKSVLEEQDFYQLVRQSSENTLCVSCFLSGAVE